MSGYIWPDRHGATILQWRRRAIDKGAGFGSLSVALLPALLPELKVIEFEWITNARAVQLYEAALRAPERLAELASRMRGDAFAVALRASGFRRIEIHNHNTPGAGPVATLRAFHSATSSVAVVDRRTRSAISHADW